MNYACIINTKVHHEVKNQRAIPNDLMKYVQDVIIQNGPMYNIRNAK